MKYDFQKIQHGRCLAFWEPYFSQYLKNRFLWQCQKYLQCENDFRKTKSHEWLPYRNLWITLARLQFEISSQTLANRRYCLAASTTFNKKQDGDIRMSKMFSLAEVCTLCVFCSFCNKVNKFETHHINNQTMALVHRIPLYYPAYQFLSSYTMLCVVLPKQVVPLSVRLWRWGIEVI